MPDNAVFKWDDWVTHLPAECLPEPGLKAGLHGAQQVTVWLAPA